MPPAARGSFEKPPLDPTKLFINEKLLQGSPRGDGFLEKSSPCNGVFLDQGELAALQVYVS